MAVVNNKTCIVCSNKYSYCPSCKTFNKFPTWMNMFDTENCKHIYEACASFTFGNTEKALSEIDGCDTSVVKNEKLLNDISGIKLLMVKSQPTPVEVVEESYEANEIIIETEKEIVKEENRFQRYGKRNNKISKSDEQ